MDSDFVAGAWDWLFGGGAALANANAKYHNQQAIYQQQAASAQTAYANQFARQYKKENTDVIDVEARIISP